MIVTGLRGVGKTVLLNRFVQIAAESNWEVVEFEASKHDDGHSRQTMFSQLKSALLRLSPRARWSSRARRAAEILTAFAVSVDQQGTWSMDRATPLQTAYMRAMAELGPEPQKASEVARLLERDSTQLGPTRAELIEMGLLFTPEHGYAAFTVPDFDKFMKRAVPNLEVPPLQQRQRRGDSR